MKQIVFMLFVFILIGCNQNQKRNKLIGTWDVVNVVDIDTMVEESLDSNNAEFVEVSRDSLYLGSDTVYSWRIKGDSIILNEGSSSFSVFIKELSADKLIVEYDFLGVTQLTLKKRK